jgi:hypothetical protein
MMKDQRLIKECIHEQKYDTSIAFCKLYRLIKAIKREIDSHQDSGPEEGQRTSAKPEGLINMIIKLCRDSFNKLKDVGPADPRTTVSWT